MNRPGATATSNYVWDSFRIHKGSGSGATWGGKSHYRGKEIRKREKGVDAFACNQVRLLLAGFGYQIMHVQRAVLERVTGTGWSLRRLAERVLRTPARFTVSGRRITMTTGGASAHWRMLARGLATLGPPDSAAAPPRRPLSRPCGPHGAEVSPSAGNRPSAPGELRVPHPDPDRTAPENPFGAPSPLPEPRQPPRLLSTSRFMNKVGSWEEPPPGRVDFRLEVSHVQSLYRRFALA